MSKEANNENRDGKEACDDGGWVGKLARLIGWSVMIGGFGFSILALTYHPRLVRYKGTSSACINNLRQIDGAKLLWALEAHAGSNAIPTWENIHPYLGRGIADQLPVCPKGGHYTLGKISQPPTCSIKEHKLE